METSGTRPHIYFWGGLYYCGQGYDDPHESCGSTGALAYAEWLMKTRARRSHA